MNALQEQYNKLICERKPDEVRNLWNQTEVPPNEKNLELILEVGKRVQEVSDIKAGKCVDLNTPTDPKYFNLYTDILASKKSKGMPFAEVARIIVSAENYKGRHYRQD